MWPSIGGIPFLVLLVSGNIVGAVISRVAIPCSSILIGSRKASSIFQGNNSRLPASEPSHFLADAEYPRPKVMVASHSAGTIDDDKDHAPDAQQ